ncbi:MAG: ComEC/Rec2 family competence protein [Clostridiales bacterium]|nr:ComEC/Rec2 family competence protein [Clostridiales bacterium]
MKKLINIRVPLFLAVAFILGIFSCYEWYLGNFYFGLISVLLLVALAVFFAIKRYGVWKITVIMLAFVILGFGIARLFLFRKEQREVCQESVTLTARVCDLNRNKDDFNGIYYLEDCTLSSGEKLDGRVHIRVYSTELMVGDVVNVSGELSSTYPVNSDINSYYIRNNINYELTNITVISQQSGALKLDEKVRKYIYDVSCDFMLQNSDIMYALLTGDRTPISNQINYVFSRAGILHLLAVSGLHVGFVVAIICLALKRLRLPTLVECAILLVPLLLYAYICAFTPSVMRAIVMVVCSYVARACFGRYDMLSAISWSALLILLVHPFYLFDVGFQLSFLSVYGIATMYTPINRWLRKRRINRVLRYMVNAFVLSLSCGVATVFTVAINFGEVPVFAALLNIVVIPLISVAFTLGICGLIPSVFHYLLLAADYVLRVVVSLAHAVSLVSFATVVIAAVSISTVIVAVVLFVFGGFVNINKLGKRIFYPICAILLICSMFFSFIPISARNQIFVSVQEHSAVVAAVSNSGEAALVLDFNEYYTLYYATEYLHKFNLKSCTVYISDCSSATSISLAMLDRLPIDEVYILGADDSETVEAKFASRGVKVIHQFPNSTTGNYVKVQSHFGAGLMGVSVSVNKMKICIACGNINTVTDLIESGIVADLYVLPEANQEYSDRYALTVTPYQSNLRFNYGANKYGNFTINQKGDKIVLTFR